MGKQEKTEIAVIDFTKFSVTQLPELKGKKEEIASIIEANPVVEVIDNKTYELAKKSRTAVKTLRTGLEKEQKDVKDKIKQFVLNVVDSEYNALVLDVKSKEKERQDPIDIWEEKKEKERQEKLRIEEARKQKHRDNIELVFNHNKKLIDELTFENLPHELVFTIDDQEFNSESFEEFADVFEAKVDVLTTMLKDKIKTLQEKENIRLENERLENERKENERKQKIKTSIDYFYTTWQDIFSDMRFEDIQELTEKFNSENALDCAEFQEDYAQKRANLVRMLEAKVNFLTQAENQRIQQEKLNREQAELEQLNRDLEAKQKRLEEVIPEPTLKGIIPEEQSIISDPNVNEIEVIDAEIVSGNTEEEKVNEEIQPTDEEIKNFLLELAKEHYSHGDNFFAHKNKKGNWEFGSTNDEPLKFGKGYTHQLNHSLVVIIYKKINCK